MGAPRLAVLFTSALLVAGALSGCEGAVEQVTGPDPTPAAEALVADLGDGEFTRVGLADGTPAQATKQYAAVVAGLGDVEPTVTLGDVHEIDDTAVATISWSWPLGDQEWAYESEAQLSLVDDEWVASWDPAVVEPSLRDGETLDLDSLTPERGGIIGAGGLALMADRPVRRFGIDRSQVPAARAGESARRLAELVDIDVAPYVKQVEAAGDAAFVEAIVYRREDVPVAVARGYDDIRGSIVVTGELPLAPTREFAAPILGTVGEVTAEMIEQDPDAYSVGDVAGRSGLQARYDEQLRGTPGVAVQAVSDDEERDLFRVDPVKGTPLRLTMDLDLQMTAERLLSAVGPASALVAIRPSTGDIVAAANGPGTNGYNMATFGQFAPGSTFKSVSTLALLRAGLTASTPVPCTTSITVDGKRFENYDDYPPGGLGRIPLRTALANSCNTAFISQAGKLDDDALVDAAASLGMGIDHDLGFPAYFGNVVPPASETEKAADLIGQGKILASPMVMATVIASVQAGELVVPRLVRQVEVSAPDEAEPLGGGEAAALKAMLRGVVTGGSGALLADVPGGPVIAKTGTAEYVDDRGRLATHAWMIGAHDDLAVAVFVETGDSGSGTAGPILEAFLRAAR
jgi:hypothetical protein